MTTLAPAPRTPPAPCPECGGPLTPRYLPTIGDPGDVEAAHFCPAPSCPFDPA